MAPLPAGDDGADPGTPALGEALRLHDEGRLDEALAEGHALLATLQTLQLDSAELRFLLGRWAIEAGDGKGAEAQLEAAIEELSAAGELAVRARAELRAARSLAYGPDVVALAEAEALFEDGAWAEADEAVKRLFAVTVDEDVLRRGEALRRTIYLESVALAEQHLALLDALLEGDWEASGWGGSESESESGSGGVASHYAQAQELLAVLQALPDDAVDPSEVARRRSRLAERVAATSVEARAVLERELDATLDEARSLVAANRYREALVFYTTLEGTARQALARGEAGAAVDALVKEERLRAGRLFVAARKEASPEARADQLQAVRDLLASLLADFPRSRYARRVADNLATVEDELSKAVGD